MPVDNELIRISNEEEQDIKDNDPTTIPIDASDQGWTGDQIRAQIAASITGEQGSVLSELKEKTGLIADKFNEVDEQMTTRDNDVDTLQNEMDAVETRATNLENGKVNKSGDTITGNLDMDDNDIVNVNIEANSVLINDFDVQDLIDFKEDILDGSQRAKKAETTDDGQGNANTAQAIKQTVNHVNQDVKDNSTPTFVGVTLGDKTLTNQKLADLDAAKQHADINSGNPHETVANDILVDATAYTAPNEPLNVNADTIQKAFNQLYAHNHDQEYIKLSQLGIDSVEGENAITGVATLGTDGKVVVGQLPSYVDDIVEFNTLADLTAATKEVAKIYVVTSDPTPANNTSYRVTASGELVKFDHTSAEWGHVTGEIINQIDIENATFTPNTSGITSITLKTAIQEVKGYAKNIKQGNTPIDFLDADLSATNVAAAISEVQDNLDEVVDGTQDITYGQTTVAATLGDLVTRLGTAETNIGSNDTDISGLNGRLTTAETDINTLETDVDNIVNGTTNITFGETTVASELASLDGRLDTAETDITNIENGTTNITFNPESSGLDSTNLQAAIKEIYAEKGANNGIATLDSTGRLPVEQLTLEAVGFKGTFGSVNSTTGGDLPSTGVTTGDLYICDTNDYASSVSGLTFNNGDKALFDGSAWRKNDAFDAVTSVNTKVGSVQINAVDVPTDTSSFNGFLDTNDTSVQSVLDKFDDHVHTFAEVTEKPTTLSGFGITDAYTKTELNDGQLDTRYYTETELNNGQLDNRYYTETEIDNGQLDNRYYTETEVNNLLDNKVNTSKIFGGDEITYDNEDSTLAADNVKLAIDELDSKILDSLTTIRVEQFEIVNPDVGDGTFTYLDANATTRTGAFDGTWRTFNLQVAGFYANNNLVETIINDNTIYHTSDTDQLQEGTPDVESIVTSVRVAHNFVAGDEIDIRYYQGVSIVAQAIGDGSVTYAKLDANLKSKADDVTNATSSNNANTLVKRNTTGEFAGILDGKFKTARTIALDGDVSGQTTFDGSTGITITTVVADDSHGHTNLGGAGLTYNTQTASYDVDKATTLQAEAGSNDTVFMTPAKTKSYVDNATIDGGTF